jgi:hypothetical protein
MSDLSAFGDPRMDKLAGLVFELAAQLHVERQRRLALETALVRAGHLAPDAVASLAGDAGLLEAARADLDGSIRGLLRIVTEDGDARGPLRAETPGR